MLVTVGDDEMVYRVPCRDAVGRAREVRVRLTDDPAVAVDVPPPGHAVIELDDVGRMVDSLLSMQSIGEAVLRREGRDR